ncbi:MAG: cytidine deaminase [Clostridiaceae bacterium]|nr:cytidine deaminase [Clostridiaceae bacterium]
MNDDQIPGKGPTSGQKTYTDEDLVTAASNAREQAYAPYSGFRVGAALLDEQNRLFTGCNIENASYGATCCGERTAIYKAVSGGARKIKRLAVVGDQPEPCWPCGICRQVIAEFAAPDFILLAAAPDGHYVTCSLEELLPFAFSFKKTSL